MIARKNAKSEMCSGIAMSEFILGNAGSDIVCSSNDDTQAKIVYKSIDCMRELIDPKSKLTWRNQFELTNLMNNSKVFKLSSTTRNKEGRNIDFAIIDEVHEMLDNNIVKSIEQSQSIKENPKLIMITTEGFVHDGFLDNELKSARKHLFQEDESIYSKTRLDWLYTQDCESEIWDNPKSWQKSNPSLNFIKKNSYLAEQVDKARSSKADRLFVLSKDFNIKQNNTETWLNSEDFNYEATFDLKDFQNSVCLGMVDLSQTTDLTCAKVMMIKKGDSTKYIHSQYFIPQTKLLKEYDDHQAGAKYNEWATKGLVSVCNDNEINLDIVADWFYDLYEKYKIKLLWCGYDQRFSKEWIKRMNYYGWTKESGELEMVLQNAETLNNAIRLCENDFKSHKINFNKNEVDLWNLKNACLKINDRQQALIIKSKASSKIDGAVTLAGLYEMYRRHKSDFLEIINKEK